MPLIELRINSGSKSPGDLLVNVQEKTYEFLSVTESTDIRVSAYLDRNWPMVETRYQELYVSDDLKFKVASITAGSKTRKVNLPGEMHEGEQLIISAKKSES